MYLSTHFTLEELTFSETALRFGIDNTPGERERSYLEHLAEQLLEPLRAKAGPLHVNSALRVLEVNRRVGSKDTSAHIDGRAADVVSVVYRPLVLCRMVVDLKLPFDQVIHEFGRWAHVAIARAGEEPRRQSLTIDKYGTRVGLLEARA